MEEQFYMITKHATTFRIRSGVTKDGRIVARECDVWWNGGAYADIGPRVTQKSGFTAAGPYDIDNVRIDSYELYTNRPPAGALRGFGIPQLVWAYESHTDLIARELGIDPIEFRRRNILRDGRPHATGTIMRDAAIEQRARRGRRAHELGAPFDRGHGVVRRGRGVAIGIKASIAPTTSVAIVNVSADGSARLCMDTVDMGQGSDTAMAQIVAEVLDIAAESVSVIHPDTDVTPYDMGTLGSRSTFHMGHAVQLAAEDARASCRRSPRRSACPRGRTSRSPRCSASATACGPAMWSARLVHPELQVARSGDRAVGQRHAVLDDRRRRRRSRSRHRDRACAGDPAGQRGRCRPPINPEIARTQLSGAAIMQLGFTLFEEMQLDGGQVTNASLADYKIPGIRDIPRWSRARRGRAGRPVRSAPRGSANPEHSAFRLRSPTRSTMRSASG